MSDDLEARACRRGLDLHPVAEPTPEQLARTTFHSLDDWQYAHDAIGHRPDWPGLVRIAISFGWSPRILPAMAAVVDRLEVDTTPLRDADQTTRLD